MTTRRLTIFLVVWYAGFFVMADEPISVGGDKPATADNDYPGGIVTMGGRQLWGDMRFFRGWRIQRHVLTGHCRLLDSRDHRHAAGTLEECEQKLQQIRNEKNMAAMSGKAVILIHGLGRSSKSFSGMAKALAGDGYTVVGFDYPSTRVSIQESAEYLRSVIESLEGITSIDVVCHSMGGLLLRTCLSADVDQRLHRAVMMGVPNKGSQMADMLKNNPLFRGILGPAGQQLGTEKDNSILQMPTPTFEFGVLAGGRSAARGYNPVLPGDNDTTVTVASTRLPGAADFLLLPVIHSLLMNDERSIQATRCFLQHGRFSADRPPHPISPSDITIVE